MRLGTREGSAVKGCFHLLNFKFFVCWCNHKRYLFLKSYFLRNIMAISSSKIEGIKRLSKNVHSVFELGLFKCLERIHRPTTQQIVAS